MLGKLYFDGGKRNNKITYGIIILDADEKILLQKGGSINENTYSSNIAEYIGLIVGILHAIDLGITQLEIRGDSLLVVNQIKGLFRVKSDNLIFLHRLAASLLRKNFTSYKLWWICREQNAKADRLTRG